MVAKPDHGQIRVDESGARFGKQSRAQLTSSVNERMSLISAGDDRRNRQGKLKRKPKLRVACKVCKAKRSLDQYQYEAGPLGNGLRGLGLAKTGVMAQTM